MINAPTPFKSFVIDRLFDVILIRSIAIRIATQAGHAAHAVEIHAAPIVDRQQLRNDAAITPLRDGQMLDRHVTQPHGFCNRIHEHARSRCFQIIAGARSLVEHLIPQASVAILNLCYRCYELIQDGADHRSGGVFARQIVQHIDQRHRVPAHGPAPEMRRTTGDRDWPSAAACFHPRRDTAGPSVDRAHARPAM